MNRADLEDAWQAAGQPEDASGLVGRLAPYLEHRLGVLLAVDGNGLRHVLIPAAAGATEPAKSVTQGLEARLDELRVDGAPPKAYFDVACTDAAMHANFAAVATEILEALEIDASDPSKTLERIFARWRWFWGVPPDRFPPRRLSDYSQNYGS